MDRHWKQLEGLATNSRRNVFFWARLKLTGLYVLIVAVIICGFSIFLYNSISHNLRDVSDDEFADSGSHQHFVNNTLGSVEEEILLADIFILLISAGVSYALAGYTLHPIQRSVEAQKAFSENASHELRTPLAVMKNDIEVLLRNPNPSKDHIHSTLRSNVEEIDRMTTMTKDLLVLARSESRVPADLETVAVLDVAERMAEKMRPLAAEKGVSVTVTGHPADVHGSRMALEHILLNLLKNAIEHTPAGGSITVQIANEKGEVGISVKDTGSGIAEKDLPHLFERFYKGESAAGTGLGLAIVKELTNQHQGSIQIKSTVGEGTLVSIRLPAVS